MKIERDDRKLLRAIGRWDLLALAINGIVGAGIFGLPAKVDALLGVSGLWAIVACAVIIGLIIVCFSEVASRFTQTGGPIVYAATAFGPLTGFLTGWVLWVAQPGPREHPRRRCDRGPTDARALLRNQAHRFTREYRHRGQACSAVSRA